MIRAVLFDFDGTLLRSSVSGDKALQRFFHIARCLSLPVEEEHREKATKMWGACHAQEIVAQCWPRQDFELFIREWCRLDALPEYMPPLVSGARETLLFLKQRGIILGIFTDRDKESFTRISTSYDILHFFTIVWTRDNLSKNGKSNPKSAKKVRRSLRYQDVERNELLFVGDAKIDLECARAAGMPFVGVLSGFSKKEHFMALGLPEERIIDSIASLPAFLSRMA